MLDNKDSVMWEIAGSLEDVNGRTSFDAWRRGDESATKVVDTYIHYVATGVINIINALQPEIICVVGGVGHEGENILQPLRKAIEAERYSVHSSKQTKIMSAVLGNDAGILGAALLDE